jgi:type IV pilus assembly protein PilW
MQHINHPFVPRTQAGLSLVELMVGLAVGLLVVAAAGTVFSRHLAQQQRLGLHTQVQQDLRAAADLVARELRRAGHWPQAGQGVLAAGTAASAAMANPFATLSLQDDGQQASQLTYSYGRPDGAGARQGGVRLAGQALQVLMDGAGWQTLTDANTLRVTRFDVTLHRLDLPLPCVQACPPDATACPPVQQQRAITVHISGQSAQDSSVQRSLNSHVKLRNDVVIGACPA